jgi:Gpi18-like mannosyltransferase
MKTPGILSLIGGLITLLVGVGITLLGAFFASVAPGAGLFAAIAGILGIYGIILGIVLIVFAFKEENRSLAIVALVLSIIGLITGQGIYVGPILGIIGSALVLKGNSSSKAKRKK